MVWHGTSAEEIERPAVPGTGELGSPEFADSQRGPSVWTAVNIGKELVVETANQDGSSLSFDRCKPSRRQVCEIQDWDEP